MKWRIFKKISLGELFVVKILGPGGYSMYDKTFGNMIHPSMGPYSVPTGFLDAKIEKF